MRALLKCAPLKRGGSATSKVTAATAAAATASGHAGVSSEN